MINTRYFYWLLIGCNMHITHSMEEGGSIKGIKARPSLLPQSVHQYRRQKSSSTEIQLISLPALMEKLNPLDPSNEPHIVMQLQLCLEKKQDIDITLNDNKETALFIAAKTGYFEVVKKLIEYDADINKSDIHNISPLAIALLHGYDKVSNLLIKNQAEISANKYYAKKLFMNVISNNQQDAFNHNPNYFYKIFRDIVIKDWPHFYETTACLKTMNLPNDNNKTLVTLAKKSVEKMWMMFLAREFGKPRTINAPGIWGNLRRRLMKVHINAPFGKKKVASLLLASHIKIGNKIKQQEKTKIIKMIAEFLVYETLIKNVPGQFLK